METINFNTQTVPMNHDDLLTGIKTKIFALHESEMELWKDLPNVVKAIGLPHIKSQYQVRVIIPDGYRAYSHGRVIRDGKLVFTFKD